MPEIDPVEFGKLQAEVTALRRDNDRQMDLLEKLDAKFENGFQTLTKNISTMSTTLSEAKGGWRMFIGVGTAIATVGGGFGWLLHEFFKFGR